MRSAGGSPTGGADDGDEGAPLVRPYALVGGRTRAGKGGPLPVETIVVTTAGGSAPHLSPESLAILRHCETPSSIAEISAHLHLPVGVVRVLVADLGDDQLVHLNLPSGRAGDGSVDRALLERVLAGIEAL